MDWANNTPAFHFFQQLYNDRVDDLLSSPEWLRSLGKDPVQMKWWLRNCGHIFEERNVCLYKAVSVASGTLWDEEDEQKCAHLAQNFVPPELKKKPRQPRHAFGLDYPRESSVRERQEEKRRLQVRASDERRKGNLQKGRRCEDFYRRAGGGCP